MTRDEIARRRATLNETSRRELDQAFHAAFLRATGALRRAARIDPVDKDEQLEALGELRELHAQGAGTAAFDDSEVAPSDNVGSVVKDWLARGSKRTPDADMAEALELCIDAGPAFMTNRGYLVNVNGGVPAIFFVCEWFVRPEEQRVPSVLAVFEAMCAAAGPSSPFWGSFQFAFLKGFLGPLGRAGGQVSESQRKLARRGLELVLDPADPELGRANWAREVGWWENPALIVFRALLAIADPDLTRYVLRLAASQGGLFRGLPALLPFTTGEQLLKCALTNAHNRAALGELLRRSSWIRDRAFTCPKLVASLARRRETKLLKILLGVDLARARALRDEHGNDLLMIACATKGRTEKMVELLLARGFDPTLKNGSGESALDLAAHSKNPRLLRLLSGARR